MSTYDHTDEFMARYRAAVDQATAAGVETMGIYDNLRSAQYSALLEHVARLTIQATLGTVAADDQDFRDKYRRTIETRIDNRALEIAANKLQAEAVQ